MKDETVSAAIEYFVGLNPKIYSYLVDDNSEQKKTKGVNKNVAATISHNEYKDVLLIKKCFKQRINRVQSKDHRIRTYEINKISLFCFGDKIYIQNNGWMWWISSWLPELIIKNSSFSNYSKKLFYQENCFNFQSNQDGFFVKNFKFEKLKTLKKELNEELMAIAQHPKKWWKFRLSEDVEKETESIFRE